jgi:CxxC-x17-CxxC domain-containing protein
MPSNPADDKTVYFARTNFRGEDRIFGIKARDRRQHMYVIGKSGTGKTVLLKNLAIQDIQNGSGVAIVDPHGEFVEEVVDSIPPHRINDVIYFNPSDSEFPVGFNVLEVSDPKYKHLVAADLMGIFTKIWANVWSARMEYIMQNCVMALLDTPGTTLLGIPRLLVDKQYRARIVSNIKDPVVRQFWVQEFENYTDRLRSEAIVPIQNKVGQFLNTSMVRNIVGQPKSTFNVQEAMNTSKILLVNVSKGRIGEDNSALLGAMVITKLQLAAMQRVDMPLDQLRDFYLYVDEFQNFSTDSFASVLSEARKYRLDLTLAHQYIGQLVTDVSTKVRDAIFGNAGTIISFRVGAQDAEFLETEYTPEIEPTDMVSLPNYHIYLKLMVDGFTSRPFSATTLPPIPVKSSAEIREKVVRVSRERYALPREKVEDRIMRWSGMIEAAEGDPEDDADDFVPLAPPSSKTASSDRPARKSVNIVSAGSQEKSDNLPAFDATCARCGRITKVNFQPDGVRPVFCKLCLPIVRSEEMRGLRMTSDTPRAVSAPVYVAPVNTAQGRERSAYAPQFAQKTFRTNVPPQSKEIKHDFQMPIRPSAPAPGMRNVRAETRPPIPHPQNSLRQMPVQKPISLSEALNRDGLSFSGKPIKKQRKEVNLEDLREALSETLLDAAPEADKKDTKPITVEENATGEAGFSPRTDNDAPHADISSINAEEIDLPDVPESQPPKAKGLSMQPGQKIRF